MITILRGQNYGIRPVTKGHIFKPGLKPEDTKQRTATTTEYGIWDVVTPKELFNGKTLVMPMPLGNLDLSVIDQLDENFDDLVFDRVFVLTSYNTDIIGPWIASKNFKHIEILFDPFGSLLRDFLNAIGKSPLAVRRWRGMITLRDLQIDAVFEDVNDNKEREEDGGTAEDISFEAIAREYKKFQS